MSFPNRPCATMMGSEIDDLARGGRIQPMFDPGTRECVGEGNWCITEIGMAPGKSLYACNIHVVGWRRYGASAVDMGFVIEEF
jgi:hypothetical protein